MVELLPSELATGQRTPKKKKRKRGGEKRLFYIRGFQTHLGEAESMEVKKILVLKKKITQNNLNLCDLVKEIQ